MSQINGCAHCPDMHSKDLRAEGETEQKLYMLDAWREASLYSKRERAALAWQRPLQKLKMAMCRMKFMMKPVVNFLKKN